MNWIYMDLPNHFQILSKSTWQTWEDSHGFYSSHLKSFTKNKLVLEKNNKSPCKIWLGSRNRSLFYIFIQVIFFCPLYFFRLVANKMVKLRCLLSEMSLQNFSPWKLSASGLEKKSFRYRKLTLFSQYNWFKITLNLSQFLHKLSEKMK